MIVGGAGEVGQLVERVLTPVVTRLELVDPRAEPGQDVMCWLEREDNLLRSADCVVLAVPEEVALRAVGPLAKRMREGALLADTLSVKGPVVAEMRRLPGCLEKLSINPMFAPVLDLHGRSVLAVEVDPGPRSALFLELFRCAGCRVVSCGAAEHDRATAALQVMTHTAVLSFGAALAEHGEDLEELLPVAPPPFVALMALLARIAGGRAATYFDIQHANRHARLVRKMLVNGERRVESAIAAGPSGFSELLSGLADLLGPRSVDLERQAQQMLEALRREEPTGPRRNGKGGSRNGIGGSLVGEVTKRTENLLEKGV